MIFESKPERRRGLGFVDFWGKMYQVKKAPGTYALRQRYVGITKVYTHTHTQTKCFIECTMGQ